jgi:uncharacterized protein YjbJ (UPF0337 family)
MNKDQVKGRAEQAVGKAKEVAGKTVGNKNLEDKGRLDEAAGKVRANYGDVKSDMNKKHPSGEI